MKQKRVPIYDKKGNRILSAVRERELILNAVQYFMENRRKGVSIKDVARQFGVPYGRLRYNVKKVYPEKIVSRKSPDQDRNIHSVDDLKLRIETDLLHLAREVLNYKRSDLSYEGICDPPDPVHVHMAKMRKRPERFKAVWYPRGVYKTTVWCICGNVQDFCADFEATNAIFTDPLKKAREAMQEVKYHLAGNQTLKRLYGEFKPPKRDPDRPWDRDRIYINQRQRISKEPSLMIGSVETDMTGKHPRVIYIDDIEQPKNITTFDQKQKVIDFLIRLIHLAGPRGELLFDGTFWTFDGPWNYLLKNWVDRKDPTTGKNLFAYEVMGILDDHGCSIMPSKYTLEYIQHLKETLPANDFSCNMLNKPNAEGNVLIGKGTIDRYLYQNFDWEALKHKVEVILISVDPGMSENPKKCFTGITVAIPIYPYDLYYEYAFKIKAKPSEVMKKLFEIANYPQFEDRKIKIGVENIAFQKMYEGSLENMFHRRGYRNVKVVGVTPNDSKDSRIYSDEPLYRHGQIHINERCTDLIYPAANYPHLGENEKDVLDSSASMKDLAGPKFRVNPYGIAEVKDRELDRIEKKNEKYIPPNQIAGYEGKRERLVVGIDAW